VEQSDVSLQPPGLAGVVVLAALVLASACSSPTSPSTQVSSVTVTCPSQLLVGQSLFCGATASFAGGGNVGLSTEIDWTSSNTNIASAGPLGLIKGRSRGQVIVSTEYRGVRGSAEVTVLHEDVLQASYFLAFQGYFITGNTVTVWLQGFYGVESAASGQLSMKITDQRDAVIAISSPLTVMRGGDSFVLSTRFTIPVGATEVCRTALLEIGGMTLSSTPPEETRCIPIKP
jgi:hypothetical protein